MGRRGCRIGGMVGKNVKNSRGDRNTRGLAFKLIFSILLLSMKIAVLGPFVHIVKVK